MRVLVIGGGFAGIAAAWQLRKSAEVLLIERRSTLGGRATSLRDQTSGEEIDNGQHLLMGCYSSTIQLLKEIGTFHLLSQRKKWEIAFYEKGGRKAVLSPAPIPSAAAFLFSLLRFSLLPFPERLRLISGIVSLILRSPDGITAQEFFQHQKQTVEVQQKFWEPLALATTNTSTAVVEISLLRTVLRLGFLGSSHNRSFLFPTVGLSSLLAPFPQLLKQQGGSIVTGQMVTRIHTESNAVVAVECTPSGQFFEADFYILALPPWHLRKLHLPLSLPKFSVSPIVTTYLWFTEELDLPEMSALIGTATQWVFHRQKFGFPRGEKFRTCLVLVTSAADRLITRSSAEIAYSCWEEVRQMFALPPTLTPAHYKVMKEHFATPIFSPRAHSQRPGTNTGISNLALAGDWTQTALPATIEGAVRSGYKAAEWIRKQTGSEQWIDGHS